MQIIDRFITALKSDKFIEAHEILEKSWKELKKSNLDEANLQKGLINGATAIALYKKDKKEAALKVWKTFEKYRNLIEIVHSKHSDKYKMCEEILDIKYKTIVQE